MNPDVGKESFVEKNWSNENDEGARRRKRRGK